MNFWKASRHCKLLCRGHKPNMPVWICMCVHWAVSVFIVRFFLKWLPAPKRWQSCKSKKQNRLFTRRRRNVPELSFRTPAIAAFLQQSGLRNLGLEQGTKSPTQFHPSHLWTFSCKSLTALVSLQETQRRLCRNEPRLKVRCRVKVVFRTLFLWSGEENNLFNFGCLHECSGRICVTVSVGIINTLLHLQKQKYDWVFVF